jgi:hypothetical protein
MTASLLSRQDEYFQFTKGLIDEDAWAQSEKIIQICLGSEWGHRWWREFSPHGFIDSFIAVVNEILEENEVEYSEILRRIEDDGNVRDA